MRKVNHSECTCKYYCVLKGLDVHKAEVMSVRTEDRRGTKCMGTGVKVCQKQGQVSVQQIP